MVLTDACSPVIDVAAVVSDAGTVRGRPRRIQRGVVHAERGLLLDGGRVLGDPGARQSVDGAQRRLLDAAPGNAWPGRTGWSGFALAERPLAGSRRRAAAGHRTWAPARLHAAAAVERGRLADVLRGGVLRAALVAVGRSALRSQRLARFGARCWRPVSGDWCCCRWCGRTRGAGRWSWSWRRSSCNWSARGKNRRRRRRRRCACGSRKNDRDRRT